MKNTLIFILSAIAMQSYAAIKWNCTSPDLPQPYLPKECTGVASGSASAGSVSPSATPTTNPNGSLFGVNFADCAASTYNAYAAGKITDGQGSGNSVCLDTLVKNLNLPDRYSKSYATTVCSVDPVSNAKSCTISLTLAVDGNNDRLINLRITYPAGGWVKTDAETAGLDPNSVIVCDDSRVCPAGTYSGTPTGLIKN